MDVATEASDSSSRESSDEEAVDDDDDEVFDDDVEMQLWIQALHDTVSDEDDHIFDMSDVEASDNDNDTSDNESEADDPYERREGDLEALPEENNPNYPQQNSNYFSTKRYVRKDKFALEKMLPDSIGLPSIMSAFKK